MMKNKNISFLARIFSIIFLSLYATSNVSAHSFTVIGRVTGEGNPLENVVVTDGFNTSVTKANGEYSLDVSPHASFIYLSTPSGYIPQDSLNVPVFYQSIRNGVRTYDFDLTKNKKDDSNHVILVHTDAQFFKEEQFQLYEAY